MAQFGKQCSDEELVKKARDGDKDAFGDLVERYSDMMYRFALIQIKDCDKAQDAAQEAFLIGYQNLMRLHNPASFASWIAGITRNVCRKLAKELKREPLSLDYLAEVGIEPGEPGNQFNPDKESAGLLRQIIVTLPPQYREIMDLRYSSDFSYKKIASVLGISMSAVKCRLLYARKLILKEAKKRNLL